MPRSLFVLFLPALLGGCVEHVAHAAWDVGTLPVKAGAKVVDWSTTSPSERDRNYVRRMRKQQEKQDRAAREEARREAKARRGGSLAAS